MKSIIEMAIVTQLIDHRDTEESLPADFVQSLREFATAIRDATLEEVEKKVPGGKHTDKWESCRIADYNQGWNDYRKQCAAAIRALKDQT